MQATFVALRRYWGGLGIGAGPGASDGDLAAFEARFGVRLAPDVRAYFREVNRMSSSADWRLDMDDDLIRLYPLAECRPLSDEWPETKVPGAAELFVFGDYSIWCWGYAVRLDASGQPGAVHVIYDAESVPVAESFGEFLARYAVRDAAVTFPR